MLREGVERSDRQSSVLLLPHPPPSEQQEVPNLEYKGLAAGEGNRVGTPDLLPSRIETV